MSVHVVGRIEIVDDVAKKADVLNALMQKLQPEGGYEPLEASHPMYKKALENIGICRLHPTSLSCKLKAGQNLNEERKALLIEKLSERGTPLDLLSVRWIQQMSKSV